MQPLWYRNAVVYEVDPALFRDADGDGWGDLRGLADRLDHVRGLGATCLWMLPFYASPYRDGGYDVVDHLTVGWPRRPARAAALARAPAARVGGSSPVAAFPPGCCRAVGPAPGLRPRLPAAAVPAAHRRTEAEPGTTDRRLGGAALPA